MPNVTVTVPSRQIRVLQEADVVIAGAGLGGVCAALAAARNGARTVLLERNAFPGGVTTAGLMMSACNYFVTRDGEWVSAGLAKEIVDRLVEAGGAMPDYARPGQPQVPHDPEVLKRVLIAMLRETGVTTLYGVLLTQVLSEDGWVEALVCEAKGGPFALRAMNYVDATGDLDLLALAGGPFATVQGFSTLLFRMGNVDIDAIVDWYAAHPESYDERADVPTSLQDTIRNWRQYGVFHLPHYAGKQIGMVREALESGAFSPTFGQHAVEMFAMGMFSCRANHGMVLINSMAFRGDEYDIVRKSQCEEEGRLAAKYLADFLVQHFPGFRDAYIVDTAAEIGVRQLRTLRGRCTLSAEEFRTGKRFEDVVGRSIMIDRTPPSPGRSVQAGEIPFGCLVADAPTNVVCATGRGASTSPSGLLRIQVPTMVIGQAAGTASALASQGNAPVTEVPVPALQATLRAQGVLFGPNAL